jgi:hypothetical protein
MAIDAGIEDLEEWEEEQLKLKAKQQKATGLRLWRATRGVYYYYSNK